MPRSPHLEEAWFGAGVKVPEDRLTPKVTLSKEIREAKAKAEKSETVVRVETGSGQEV